MRSTLAIAALLAAMSGCANHVYSLSYSPITKEYAQQLDQVALGMTKPQLRTLFPDMVTRGQTAVGGQQVEAMELSHNYWTGVGGRLEQDQLWFYFYNGRLVKWGRPNDWPDPRELVIRAS